MTKMNKDLNDSVSIVPISKVNVTTVYTVIIILP